MAPCKRYQYSQTLKASLDCHGCALPRGYDSTPTSPGVPTLPPSVEEAYRRKCVFLKQRMADVEEANDAVRVRLARLKRQVEKQRLERAFLLEQLAKRTSTNVEDSDGSPSPPATPKDKPLRTKRGHRKSSVADGSGAPGSTFISQNLDPLSPSSDVFGKGDSQTQPTQSTPGASQRRGGRRPKATKEADDGASVSGKGKGGDDKEDRAAGSGSAAGLKRPGNAFELYCDEMRPTLVEKRKTNKQNKKKSGEDGDDVDMEDADAEEEEEEEDEAAAESAIDAELARGWTEMEQAEKDEFETRAAEEQAKYKKAKEEARQLKEKTKEDKDEKDGKEAGDEVDVGDKDGGKEAAEKATANDDKVDQEVGDDTGDKAEDKDTKSAAKEGEDTEMADPDSVAVATSSADKDE
ncbi:uncharacterized protein SPSK_05295 [Sporothrix schenckii 1099-18]|uniref:HMG box domain-containing protein n=1 Tax=Sporothrix schenckii 1099-18 TaxID=1397361 RepID=A0A0F2LWD2_SPOSC|nr:uncharacterized protein SPSK_05295 [Sporothrix schenckii 1099-18]KJR80805.1 hypothetical protein SPSK_05295 [Sporothrix schenckii 1099-18]